MSKSNQPVSLSDRILVTPSLYAQQHYLYVQEVGTLTSLRPHISKRDSLKSYLFMTIKCGKGTITCQGKRMELLPGDCAYIDCSKGYYHESSHEDPWTLSWVHFYGNLADEYYKQYNISGFSSCFHPNNSSTYMDLLRSIYQHQQNSGQFGEMSCHCALTELLTQIFTDHMSNENETDVNHPNTLAEKLRMLRIYIAENISEDLSLDQLSKQSFISKYHLAREYHREFGITIGYDITTKRLSTAKSLLRFTQDTIESISTSCGFSDPGYFTKVFKQYEKLTPSEYRSKWL